ncbi:MAG: hypothetical protein LBT27_03335 [Prevotellaceae bacterium]|jgi:hypothetical protein|nr:hypothetical protein [Prevotellaceae bacterium]
MSKINGLLQFLKLWLLGIGVFYISVEITSLGEHEKFKLGYYIFISFIMALIMDKLIKKQKKRENPNQLSERGKKIYDFFIPLAMFIGLFCIFNKIFESEIANLKLYYIISLLSSFVLLVCYWLFFKKKYAISNLVDSGKAKINILNMTLSFSTMWLSCLGWFYFIMICLSLRRQQKFEFFLFFFGALFMALLFIVAYIWGEKRKRNLKPNNFVNIIFMLMGIFAILGRIFENVIGNENYRLYNIAALCISVVLSAFYLLFRKPKRKDENLLELNK